MTIQKLYQPLPVLKTVISHTPVTAVTLTKKIIFMRQVTLLLTFTGGEKRIYNAKPLLEKPLYTQLRNPSFFLTAKADCGTVVWDDDIDIAPEHLYESSIPM